MSATTYTPSAHSLAMRVLVWLRQHPALERITLEQISEECDAVRGNIHTHLRPAVDAELLLREKDGDGNYVYKRGREFFAFKGSHAPLTAAMQASHAAPPAPTPRRSQGAGPVDLTAIPIDDNVPLTRGHGTLQDFAVLLRRLERPGQSAALPARLRSPVTKAIQQWHKAHPSTKFCVRKASMDSIRVHRVA